MDQLHVVEVVIFIPTNPLGSKEQCISACKYICQKMKWCCPIVLRGRLADIQCQQKRFIVALVNHQPFCGCGLPLTMHILASINYCTSLERKC